MIRSGRRLILAAAGCAVAGVAVEAALRAVEEPSALIQRPSDVPGLVYELIPHLRAEAHGWRWSMSAEGWRDRDYPETRTPGVPRVLGIGNSIAMGRPDPDRSALSLLEERLAPAEVINAGVAGYTARQVRIALEAKGLRYAPDLVLYLWCPNDALPVGAVDAEGRIRGGGAAAAVAPPTVRERLGDLLRRSLLLRRLAHAVNLAAVRLGHAPPLGDFVPYTRRVHALYDPRGTAWNEAARDIRAMRAACVRAGARFAVVGFPLAHQFYDGGPDTTPQALLERLCVDEGIPHLDLTPALGAAGGRALFDPGDPVHPNDAGHAVAAEAIARWIREEGLLP